MTQVKGLSRKHMPEGLTVFHTQGIFWWNRRDRQPGQDAFFVCVSNDRPSASLRTYRIDGYVGECDRDWWQLGFNRDRLLLRNGGEGMFFSTVSEVADDVVRQTRTDLHCLVVFADTHEQAEAHPDVQFIVRQIDCFDTKKPFTGVYFISNGNGAVKIGQTKGPLETRMTSLQVGSPNRLYLVAAVATGRLDAIEKKLHKLLAGKRMTGEWFSLTDSEAVEIAVQHGGKEWQGAKYRRSRVPN